MKDSPDDPTRWPSLRLYRGHTTHMRFNPFERRFRYGLTLFDIDIDRFAEANRASWLFGADGPGLFSIRRRNHGPKTGAPLRPWAERLFEEAGVHLAGGPIRLVSFAKHLFYRFAPISLWFGYSPDGELRGAIYEVNNTFGESHSYVAPVQGSRTVQYADKRFHVSPFFDVAGRYRFTLRAPGDRLDLIVDNLVEGKRTHMATIKARAVPASGLQLARTAVFSPFSSLGVSLGIHWEALWLWRRGARYHKKPVPPSDGRTLATKDTEGA